MIYCWQILLIRFETTRQIDRICDKRLFLLMLEVALWILTPQEAQEYSCNIIYICSIYIYIYIYTLVPRWHLSLKVNPSKKGRTSKQNSRAIPMLGFFLFGLAILCREISAKSWDPGWFDGMCWKGCGICWMISKFFATSFEPQLRWGLHQIVEAAKDSNEMYWMIDSSLPKVWTIFGTKFNNWTTGWVEWWVL